MVHFQLFGHYCNLPIAATVSLLTTTIAVTEDAGMGQICATLSYDLGTALANIITVTPTLFG